MSQSFCKRFLTVLTAVAGLAMLGASQGFSIGGQTRRPQPHAPLTVEQRNARAAYWASKRGLQFGVPENAYERALSDAKALSMAAPALSGGIFAWSAIGPQPMLNNFPNFGGLFTGPPMTTSAGRVAAVAVDPPPSTWCTLAPLAAEYGAAATAARPSRRSSTMNRCRRLARSRLIARATSGSAPARAFTAILIMVRGFSSPPTTATPGRKSPAEPVVRSFIRRFAGSRLTATLPRTSLPPRPTPPA
jgi:hypothetical protein